MKDRIKKIRKELDLTQQKFADRLGVKRNTVAQWETGVNSLTDVVITSICREFNVNEQWLRTGEGEPFRERPLSEEVGYYVEDLLDYEGHGNPFYDAIIEMMKEYTELDEKSQAVIREYFRNVAAGINEKQDG